MPTFCGGELAAGQNAAQMPANVSWQTEDGAEREGACGAQLMARTGDSGVATDQPPPSAGLKRAHPTDAFMRELAPSTSTTGSWLVREREQSRPRTSLAAAQCGSVFGQAGTTQARVPLGVLLPPSQLSVPSTQGTVSSDAQLRLMTPAEFEAHVRAHCRFLLMPIITANALHEVAENKNLAGYQAAWLSEQLTGLLTKVRADDGVLVIGDYLGRGHAMGTAAIIHLRTDDLLTE